MIVIGAGTAGSIVAATLSEDPEVQVTLIEGGEDRSEELPFNLFEAAGHAAAFWPDSKVLCGGYSSAYRRGRGLGGSSEVNGCVASSPTPEEIESWGAVTGDPYWRWEPWRSAAAAVEAHASTIDSARWGRADRALLRAIDHEKGARWKPARFAVDQQRGTRANYGFARLTEARKRPNLRIETDASVERLLIDSTARPKHVTGVRLAGGREISADHTVLCAGAIGSPMLLTRSDIGSAATGFNLVNHRGISFTWTFSSAATADPVPRVSSPVSSIVVDVDFEIEVEVAGPSNGSGSMTVQLLPLNHVGTDPQSAPYGGLLCCPLGAVASRGVVRSTASGEASIEFPLSEADRLSLIQAARIGARIAMAAVRHGDAQAAFADEHGTPASVLADMSDAELGEWVASHPAPLFHATGTCRMGALDDPEAVVDPFCSVIGTGGVSVIDASILPTLPAAGPHLAVAALAVHASRRLQSRWSSPSGVNGVRS